VVEPLLRASDQLAREIEADFRKIYVTPKPYRRGEGFVSHTALTAADTRRLAQSIDALAQNLSQVPAAIVTGEQSQRTQTAELRPSGAWQALFG
jgi:iron uptake system component EfeO